MVITVNLHTILQKQTTSGNIRRLEIEPPPGSSLADLLILLNIEVDPDSVLLVVNGTLADPKTELMGNDHVDIIPAISGGN